ncbi:MAG TPA: hypothetical protein VFA60_00720 [Terriglobales bacterium]|nr:hypothetical protein [Terriglobales bacterium]
MAQITAALPDIVETFIREAQTEKSCPHARFLFDIWQALDATGETERAGVHWAKQLISWLETEQRNVREGSKVELGQGRI